MMVDSWRQYSAGGGVSRSLLSPPSASTLLSAGQVERECRSPSKDSLSSDSGRSSLGGYASDSDYLSSRGEDVAAAEEKVAARQQLHLSLNSLPDFSTAPSPSPGGRSRSSESSGCAGSSSCSSLPLVAELLGDPPPGPGTVHPPAASLGGGGTVPARHKNHWRPLVSDIREEHSTHRTAAERYELDSGPESPDVFDNSRGSLDLEQPSPPYCRQRRRAVTRISENSDNIKSSFTAAVVTSSGTSRDMDMRLRFTDIVESENDEEDHLEGAWQQLPRPPIINVEFTDYQDAVLSDMSDNESCPGSRGGSRRSSLVRGPN